MPRGVSLRASLAPRAQRLRLAGWKLREISELLGVPIKTVGEWCADPDRVKHAARRAKYGGVCEECGKPTDGSRGPGRAAKRCRDCIQWSDDEIISAIQSWAREFGGPPRMEDWRVADKTHPSSVRGRRVKSWNDLLVCAGFQPRCDRRPETQRAVERLVAEGHTLAEAGEPYGIGAAAVGRRLRCAGTSVRELREKS